MQSVHWDHLDASAEYSEQEIAITQATLSRGDTSVQASGKLHAHQLGKARYAFDKQSAVNASLHVQNALVADILLIAGQNLPVTGTLNLQSQVSGTLENFHGGGHVAIQGGEAYGLAYRSVNADLQLNKQEIGLANLMVVQNGGRLTGSGGYDLSSQVFHFNAQGRGFELAHYPQIQNSKMPLAGDLSFEAQGSGTIKPSAKARIHIANIVVANETKGTLEAEAHTAPGALLYTVDSHLNTARVQVNGQTKLSGDYQSQVRLTLAGLDVNPYLRLFKVQNVTEHSSLNGNVNVSVR